MRIIESYRDFKEYEERREKSFLVGYDTLEGRCDVELFDKMWAQLDSHDPKILDPVSDTGNIINKLLGEEHNIVPEKMLGEDMVRIIYGFSLIPDEPSKDEDLVNYYISNDYYCRRYNGSLNYRPDKKIEDSICVVCLYGDGLYVMFSYNTGLSTHLNAVLYNSAVTVGQDARYLQKKISRELGHEEEDQLLDLF